MPDSLDDRRPKRDLRVEVYQSFEDENEAETARRARLSFEERMAEFAAIQAKTWGPDWATKPIEKTATWEWTSW